MTSGNKNKRMILLSLREDLPRFDLSAERFEVFTEEQYIAMDAATRSKRFKDTVAYLRTIPNIPPVFFSDEDGSSIEYIPEVELKEAIKKTMIVLVEDNTFPRRLILLTPAEYDALTEVERNRRFQATVTYLENILPTVPKSQFGSGNSAQAICIAKLNEAVSVANQQIKPASSSVRAEGQPRMPMAIVINWINELQKNLDEIETKLAGKVDKKLNGQKKAVKEILSTHKSNWLSHNLKTEVVAALLKEDSVALRKVGLNELADLAYRADEQPSLYQQLPKTDVFENLQTRLNDNIYGRAFETSLLYNLVEEKSDALYEAMTPLASGLKEMLAEIPTSFMQDVFIPEMVGNILAYQRPWFSKVSAVQNFLAPQVSNKDRLKILKDFLSGPITDGYQVVALVYLMQQFYVIRKVLSEHFVTQNDAWAKATEAIYKSLQAFKMETFEKWPRSHFLADEYSEPGIFKPVLGITNPHQPPIVTPLDTGPIARPTLENALNFNSSYMDSIIKEGLLRGVPYVTGISGTTNLFLGMLAHLKADLGYTIDVQGGFLGLLMFLVIDGGHSIHEALWMAHYRESFSSRVDKLRPFLPRDVDFKKYTEIGFKPSAARRPSIVTEEAFISDYEKFFGHYRNTSLWGSIEKAQEKAWKETLSYFEQYSVYGGKDAFSASKDSNLNQLFERFKQVLDGYSPAENDLWTFVTVELENLLQRRIEAVANPVPRIRAIQEFLWWLDLQKIQSLPYSVEVYQTMYSILVDLQEKEYAKKSLWDTIKHMPQFSKMTKERVLKLAVDALQYNNGVHAQVTEVGYIGGMLLGFQHMLNERSETFSSDYLLDLYYRIMSDTSKQGEFRDFLSEARFESPEKMLPCEYARLETRLELFTNEHTDRHKWNASTVGIKEIVGDISSKKNAFIQIIDYQEGADGQAIIGPDGRIATLLIKERSRKEIEKYVDAKIAIYRQELKTIANQASSAEEKMDAKLTVIAKLCRDLAIVRLFEYHDKSVIGILVLNKLLLQNGLSPAILENTENLLAFSIQEIVAQIKDGQAHLQSGFLDSQSSDSNSLDTVSIPSEKTVEIENTAGRGDSTKELEKRYSILEGTLFDEAKQEFSHGYDLSSYAKITVPKLDDKMSILEMKALALEQAAVENPNLRILGALVRRIMLAQTVSPSAAQVTQALLGVAQASHTFKTAVSQCLISQAIYTQAVDPTSAGLCYGLTWTVAALLASDGEAAVDRFAQRMSQAAEYPRARSAVLLQTMLKSIHYSANNLYINRTKVQDGLSHYSIDEAVQVLENETRTAMYEFNTRDHATMLGVIETNGKRSFYFYDANTLMVSYATAAELLKGLKNYFDRERLTAYSSFKKNGDTPAFELREIDTRILHKQSIPVEDGRYLKIKDLADAKSLHALLQEQHNNRETAIQTMQTELVQTLEKSPHLKLSLVELEQQKIAKALLFSTKKIYLENKLSDEWVPLFSKIEKSTKGYRLPFVSRYDELGAVKWITTTDEMLVNIRNYLDACIREVGKAYTVGQDLIFKGKSAITPEIGSKGLNAAFLLQTLLTWTKDYQRNDAAGDDNYIAHNLATALSLHNWVNLIQISQGISHDLAELVTLTQALMLVGSDVGVPASAWANVLGLGNQAAGIFLGTAAVGLDMYEFIHAENAVQKAVFGTQLTFDGASLATGVMAIGCELTGFATTASVLGPLSVPLAGLGVGASGLAQVYGQIDEEGKLLGSYFTAIDDAYKTGYQISNEGLLTFAPGSVIDSIDLSLGTITYGSQYLYTYDYSWLTPLDSVTDNHDRSKALNVRTALGYSDTFFIKAEDKKAGTIILPATLSSYDSTYSQLMLGFRANTLAENHSLIKLEKASNNGFRIEHTTFPFQRVLRNISHEYLATTINIKLGSDDRVLLATKLPQFNLNESIGSSTGIIYRLTGQGGQYTLGLNYGVSFVLNTANLASTATSSHWVLDASYLDSDDVVFKTFVNGNHGVSVGGIDIMLTSLVTERISVIKKDTQVWSVDIQKKQVVSSSIDAQQWKATHETSIEAHLQELAQFHTLAGRYIIVNNYQHNGINIERACYDSQQNRMLFSCIDPMADPLVQELLTLIDDLTCADPMALVMAGQYSFPGSNFDSNNSSPNHPLGKKKTSSHNEVQKVLVELKEAEKWKALLSKLQTESVSALQLQKFNAFQIELNKWLQLDNESHATKNSKGTALSFRSFSFNEANQTLKLAMSPNALAAQLASLREELLDPQRHIRNADLVAVIGDEAYFYHKDKQLLCRANVTTNQINAQFRNPVKNKGRRFWQENDALYMACDGQTEDPAEGIEPCEFIYRVDKEKMQLVSLQFGQRKSDESSAMEFLSTSEGGSPISVFVVPPDMNSPILSSSIPLIGATHSLWVQVSGPNKANALQRCWIGPRGRTIRPNLPIVSESIWSNPVRIPIPNDLIMIPTMLDEHGYGVVHFYSRSKKALYRQLLERKIGGASNSADATRVPITNLVDVLVTQDNVFAVTQEGLIYQVERSGRVTVSGLNQTWFDQHASSWITDLSSLDNKQTTLTLLGLKTTGGQVLPAWYHGKQIVIAIGSGTTFDFLDIDADGKYARLFDPINGIIYKQAIVDVTQAFDGGIVLKNPDEISAAISISLKEKISSATVMDKQLRLTTESGLLLNLDSKGVAHLVGVNQRWLEHHQGTERIAALGRLATEWQHNGVLRFQNSSPPTWFDIHSQQTIVAWGFEANAQLEFVGFDPDNKKAYIWSKQSGLYHYTLDKEANTTDSVAYYMGNNGLRRLGHTLRMSGGENDDVLQAFALKGVDTLHMYGGEGQDIYQINLYDQHHNKMVVIDNYAMDQKEDELQLEVEDVRYVKVSRQKEHPEHLVLSSPKRVVMIRNVFGESVDRYRHLNIKVRDHAQVIERSVSSIVLKAENQIQSLIEILAGESADSAMVAATSTQASSGSQSSTSLTTPVVA